MRYAAGIALVALLAAACGADPPPHVVLGEASPDGTGRAEVRLMRCGGEWCHSLWIGRAGEEPNLVATLPHDSERCDEIAWTRDGRRAAFLVNGHQLRLYESRSGAPAGLLDLVAPDGPPTSRIARGVTFSDNGRAITFDDCPRDRSGCRPGLVAMR